MPDPDDLLKAMDRATFLVNRPFNTIFLCGGSLEEGTSARARLLKRLNETELGWNIILAESAQNIFEESIYEDLVEFEADVATLCTSILLISESPGAIAELGAFSIHERYRSKLRVVLFDTHEKDRSFIMLGPVRHLLRFAKERPIYMNKPGGAGFDHPRIGHAWIDDAIAMVEKDIRSVRLSQKLNDSDEFHQMLAVNFLCWTHIAAEERNIREGLQRFDISISPKRMRQYLYALEVAQFLRRVKVGGTTYFVSLVSEPTIDYRIRAPFQQFSDRLRLRASVSAYLIKTRQERRLEAAAIAMEPQA